MTDHIENIKTIATSAWRAGRDDFHRELMEAAEEFESVLSLIASLGLDGTRYATQWCDQWR